MVYVTFSERVASRIVAAGGVATVVTKNTIDSVIRTLKDDDVRVLASGQSIGYAIRALRFHEKAQVIVPIQENVSTTNVKKRAQKIDVPGIGTVPVWVLERLDSENGDKDDGWEKLTTDTKHK